MPTYTVLRSSDKQIRVCNLIVVDENNEIQSLDVKELSGENGNIFVGKRIDVKTTNREIIPSDIMILGEEGEVDEAHMWLCKNCNEPNPDEEIKCKNCGALKWEGE